MNAPHTLTEAQAVATLVRMRLPTRPAVLHSTDDLTGGPLAGEIARRSDAALVLAGLGAIAGPHLDTARVVLELMKRGRWVRYHAAYAATCVMREADGMTVGVIADHIVAADVTVPLEDAGA